MTDKAIQFEKTISISYKYNKKFVLDAFRDDEGVHLRFLAITTDVLPIGAGRSSDFYETITVDQAKALVSLLSDIL